jgi:hypothetical protein
MQNLDRFSKKILARWIGRRLASIEQTYHFNPRNGWDQVNKKGEAANRAYGEWNLLRDLVDVFDLDWNIVIDTKKETL